MTTLREQIEALDKGRQHSLDLTAALGFSDYEIAIEYGWNEAIAAVLAIIDAHEQEDAALWGRLAYLEKWKDDRDQDARYGQRNAMTLYEQIKDSYDKSYEYIGEEPEFDSGWRAAISYILEDIISKHDCIPDRDELARMLH